MRAIDDTARQLAQAGVQGGDRVMIVSENCVAQVVLMFAVAKLDAWCLLTNARLSASENRCDPRARKTASGGIDRRCIEGCRESCGSLERGSGSGQRTWVRGVLSSMKTVSPEPV